MASFVFDFDVLILLINKVVGLLIATPSAFVIYILVEFIQRVESYA